MNSLFFQLNIRIDLSVGKKQLFCFFLRWLMCRQKKRMCCLRVGFFSSNVDV